MEIMWIIGAIYSIYLFFWIFFVHGHLRIISKAVQEIVKNTKKGGDK